VVNAALSIGATVGVLLSAGFVWLEVGRYAVPQVDVSRFDERKEMIAYTAGLFVGIPLAVPLLFLFQAIPPLAFGGIALYLTLLVAGSELAQWFVLRTVYFGRDGCGPFYALGLRCGIGGLLVLGFVTAYLSGPSWDLPGVPGLLAISAAIVALEAVSGVLALPGRADQPGRSTGPLSAVPLEAIGFFVLGFAASAGPIFSLVGGAIIAAGAAWLYRSVAPANLARIAPPGGGAPPEPRARAPFGRTDSGGPSGAARR
jgi:hypothetical protein